MIPELSPEEETDNGTADQTGNTNNQAQKPTSRNPSSNNNNEPDYSTERREILQKYQSAISSSNSGQRHLIDGINQMNNGNYGNAHESSLKSINSFENATNLLNTAVDLTYEIGNGQAREIANQLLTQSEYGLQAARHQKDAAEAAMSGNRQAAMDILDNAEKDVSSAEAINPRDSSVMESSLNLN
ncbi:MAG: hypothetical protein U5K37_01205 [Natrialbaceae archaeon]|nr:hypothetical protein [Natrialbaceae archaeon]